MSGYTSGNNAPTLMAQAPNRKGNQSKHTPSAGGVTAVTRSMGSTAYSKGHQGAPSAGGNPGSGRGQKVQVLRPADNCGCHNDSYRNSSYLA
jgi:hypothetical protein